MINLSFEKVISLSKKYASMNDEPWHRVEFLTQIVSDVIRAQGTPTQFTFKSSTLNGKEIAESLLQMGRLRRPIMKNIN